MVVFFRERYSNYCFEKEYVAVSMLLKLVFVLKISS